MRTVKDVVAHLLANPGSIAELQSDPAALLRQFGIDQRQAEVFSQLGRAAAPLMVKVIHSVKNRHAARNAPSKTRAPACGVRNSCSPGIAGGLGNEVGIVGVISLAAMVGTIAALGTVSIVALSNSSDID